MNRLIGPENMGRGNTSAGGADIEGLGEFNELCAGHVCSPQEDRHLQADAWRAPGCRSFQELPLFQTFGFQVISPA